MKKRYTDFIKDKQILSYIVPFIIILVIFIVFISSSLAALTPIESIVITSENSSYENKEQGSWQITKKANWLTKGKVKLTFDINTMSKTKAKNVDLLLVVNTSNTLSSEDFNEMKTYVNEFANNILKEGSPSRMSLINFNSSSQIVSDFTNDKTQITDSINNMQMGEGTSFYKALQSTDEILKSYQPVSGNNLVIIFLTSSLPNKDMPNEEWQYNYLKSEYPNLTINSISYEMGSNISDKIKNISDKQFAATKQTLINTLYNATDMRNIYDEFIITDYIDDTNFQIENLDSLKNDIGKVKIEYEGTTPKVIIDLSNELISGESTKISFVIDLKDDKLESGGIFSVNKSIGVTSAILENTENILSTKTPVVADNYKVSYDSNLPSGCTVEEAIPSTKRYSVFDVVRISNDISCPNYQFKGWDIVSDKKVTMVNDNNFLMPSSDIILKATWSKVSLNMSMDGQVYEPQTLNNIIEKQAVLDNEASEFVTATTGIDFANISSNTNGKGVYTMASTKDDAFPIHYYRGAVTNNNVKFANFCWKIVRTTETGGVKLIYNGVPNSTTGACSNTTGTLTQTGTSAFNDKSSALTDVGYMQGKRYESVSKQMDNYTWEGINGKTSESRNLDWYSSVKTLEQSAANLWIGGSNLFCPTYYKYYFSKTVTYSNGVYSLSSPSQIKIPQTNLGGTLKGYYTCKSESSTGTCETVYYIVGTADTGGLLSPCNKGKLYYIGLTGGETYSDVHSQAATKEWKYASAVTYSDGSYKLSGNIKSSPTTNWRSDDSIIAKDYPYTCFSESDTCTSVYYIKSSTYDTSSNQYAYYATTQYFTLSNGETYEALYANATGPEYTYTYGNDVTYSNGTYTLVDPFTSHWINWATDSSTIRKDHHYTCLSVDSSCQTVYYIYYSNNYIYYFPLTNGETVDNNYAELPSNTNSSTIKNNLDTWYSSNLTNYSKYLEDTIWCNDRSVVSKNGFDKDTTNVSSLTFNANIRKSNATPELACLNPEDKFSKSTEIGNGLLTYPLGLLTSDEVMLAGAGNAATTNNSYYLYNGSNWWTMSPSSYSNAAFNHSVSSNGYLYGSSTNGSNGIRPSISLRNGLMVYSGRGTATSPYILQSDALPVKIIGNSDIKATPAVAEPGEKITLSSISGKYVINSFKLNGELITGNTFTMPEGDVQITDIDTIFQEKIIIESEHNPYPNNLASVVYGEHTFEGATSLTVVLDYQTESTSYDWIYLYSSTGSTVGGKIGGTTRTTKTFTIPGNYIKIVFRTDSSGNSYYGFKATVTANY